MMLWFDTRKDISFKISGHLKQMQLNSGNAIIFFPFIIILFFLFIFYTIYIRKNSYIAYWLLYIINIHNYCYKSFSYFRRIQKNYHLLKILYHFNIITLDFMFCNMHILLTTALKNTILNLKLYFSLFR